MSDNKSRGPLAGVRILDMTAVVLGPLATQILGDYGADVIKIEPLEGDLMRANGAQRADGSTAGLSSIFLTINRNKRSLAIDLKSEEGRAVVRKLVATADAVAHNMRVEAIERLGFGYEAVRIPLYLAWSSAGNSKSLGAFATSWQGRKGEEQGGT